MRSIFIAAFASALTLSPLLASAATASDTAMRVSDLAAQVLKQAGTCEDAAKADGCDCKEACKQDNCACAHAPRGDAHDKAGCRH